MVNTLICSEVVDIELSILINVIKWIVIFGYIQSDASQQHSRFFVWEIGDGAAMPLPYTTASWCAINYSDHSQVLRDLRKDKVQQRKCLFILLWGKIAIQHSHNTPPESTMHSIKSVASLARTTRQAIVAHGSGRCAGISSTGTRFFSTDDVTLRPDTCHSDKVRTFVSSILFFYSALHLLCGIWSCNLMWARHT